MGEWRTLRHQNFRRWREKLLEILYNAMQRALGHDQRALAHLHAAITQQKGSISVKWSRTGLHLFTMLHVHLLEIRKLQRTVKNLAKKGVDFYVQNGLILAYELCNSKKIFRGSYSRTLVKGKGRRRKRRGLERRERRGKDWVMAVGG